MLGPGYVCAGECKDWVVHVVSTSTSFGKNQGSMTQMLHKLPFLMDLSLEDNCSKM